jgi:hypothetical protein
MGGNRTNSNSNAGESMLRIITLLVSTFTVMCMLGTFCICWVILNALKAPQAVVFIMSLFYSIIPVIVFILEDMTNNRKTQ